MNKLRRENEASGTRVVYLVDCVVCWTGLKPYYKGTSTIGLNYLARSFFHCDCIVETFVLRLIGRSLSLFCRILFEKVRIDLGPRGFWEVKKARWANSYGGNGRNE